MSMSQTEDHQVELLEENVHSFIVRLWLEEVVQTSNPTKWRGHITHIPGNERRYIKDLDEINIFIMLYLQGLSLDDGK